MAKELENIAEEIEILIALRLSGEISNQENQKLETFFASNPKTKEQFLQKEKAYSILAKSAQDLPVLQLSASKRNSLLQLSNIKKSGRSILATYVVAASAFFAFVIGLYFYTNAKFQEPKRAIALNEEKSASDSKVKDERRVEKEGVAKAPPLPIVTNEVATQSEGKANKLIQPSSDGGKKIDSSSNYEKSQTLKETDDFAEKNEKTMQIGSVEKQRGNDNEKEIKKIDALKKSKEEAVGLNGNKDSSVVADKPSVKSDKKRKDDAPAPEAKSEALVVREMLDKNEDKYNAVEKEEKEEATRDSPIKAKSSVASPKNFEYIVNIQFNQQEFKKKIISSRNLSAIEKTAKMSFHEILEYANLNTIEVSKNENRRKLNHETIKIQDQDVPAEAAKLSDAKMTKAEPIEELRESGEDSSAIAQEIALISECIVSYQKRNSLDKNAQKQLLENIKKAMNSLTQVEKDESLKQWLEAIDKELKP